MKRLWIAVCLLGAMNMASAQWKYQTMKNDMTDTQDRWAMVVSKNKEQFAFPYQGGTSLRITVRQMSGDLSTYIDIDRGQFACFSDCAISVRFNDAETAEWDVGRPSDGSSDTLFIKNSDDFLAELLKSKRVRVKATYFQAGDRVFDFNTAGLKWAIPPAAVGK